MYWKLKTFYLDPFDDIIYGIRLETERNGAFDADGKKTMNTDTR